MKTQGIDFEKDFVETLGKDTDSREIFLKMFYELPLTTQAALLRKVNGLSQVMLANKANINQPEIARIEKTNANPRVKTLENITKHIGVKTILVPSSLIPCLIYHEITQNGERYFSNIVFRHRR